MTRQINEYGKKMVQLNADEFAILSCCLTNALPCCTSLPVLARWDDIIAYACDPGLVAVLITDQRAATDFRPDDVQSVPPASLQGKLLAFLFKRFVCFKGASGKGLSVYFQGSFLATQKLEAIILELAHLNDLQPELFDWIETSVRFLSHPKD
jgi:tagaturonate reductase